MISVMYLMIARLCRLRREAANPNPVRGDTVAGRVAIRRPPNTSTPRGPGDASGAMGNVTGGSNESTDPLSMRMGDLNSSCDCEGCNVGSPCARTGAGGDTGDNNESGLGTTRSDETRVQNFGEMPKKKK